jgi:hypothetical protein
VRRPRLGDKRENLVKTLPLYQLAVATIAGALLMATWAVGADDVKDQKPAPFTPPPNKPASAPATKGSQKETVQSSVNRMRSNPYEGITNPRTAPLMGAAQGGTKLAPNGLTRTGVSMPTSVRPNTAQTTLANYRTTMPPTNHTTPLSRTTPLPAMPTLPGSKSSSPTLRERIRNLLR